MSDKETKEMEGELLPCPFCSSPAEWINEALADGHYYIRCPNCHIVMKEDRRDKVIGMWNTRSELQKAKELNGELSEALEKMVLEFSRPDYELFCDHGVGICSCAPLGIIEKAKESLIKKSEI